ncbi:MAG: glycosyltransferase family 2 protein [Thermoplasmataceae archaeon]
MSISILTRAYRSSELKSLAINLSTNNETEFEIIAVCNVIDSELGNIKILQEHSTRFRARITGIKHANYDKILLLDSDQTVEKGLLSELEGMQNDMVIIPEKSLNHNFVGACLDDWRFRNERLAMRKPSPQVPVIPRFYVKQYLVQSLSNFTETIYDIVSHEDSVLYYEIYKNSRNIGFSNKHIFNEDPSFHILIRKAFLYGKFSRTSKNLPLPEEITALLNTLNKNTFDVRGLGIGKGYFVQVARALAYKFGNLLGT